jgi:malate permease and related proteins
VTLILTTFESVAVLLGIGILGFAIIVRRVLPENALGFLSVLAIDIAVPCLIFASIVSGFNPSGMPGWWTLPLWWCGFTACAGGLAWLFSRLSRKESRQEFMAALLYQNAIFFPLAILSGIFGNSSPVLVSLFLFTMFNPTFFFSTCHLFFGAPGKRLELRKIVNTILIATLLATAVALAGVRDFVPQFMIRTFSMVGAMSIPILMIILGGNIYVDFKNTGKIYFLEIIKFVALKNVVFPLAALGMLLLIRPDYTVALILLIESAVPPITAMPVVVARSGGDRNIVNQFMFSSFLFALLSIPAMVFLFEKYFPHP